MRINKPYTDEEYADLAVYCNEHNCRINDAGDYLESVEIVYTDEEKAFQLRVQRDTYISDIEWRINRYRGQHELGIETTDTAETYIQILRYVQYLRDIPETEGFPNIEVQTFEEWASQQEEQPVEEPEETPVEEGGE